MLRPDWTKFSSFLILVLLYQYTLFQLIYIDATALLALNAASLSGTTSLLFQVKSGTVTIGDIDREYEKIPKITSAHERVATDLRMYGQPWIIFSQVLSPGHTGQPIVDYEPDGIFSPQLLLYWYLVACLLATVSGHVRSKLTAAIKER